MDSTKTKKVVSKTIAGHTAHNYFRLAVDEKKGIPVIIIQSYIITDGNDPYKDDTIIRRGKGYVVHYRVAVFKVTTLLKGLELLGIKNVDSIVESTDKFFKITNKICK